jgi:hypothetical protein
VQTRFVRAFGDRDALDRAHTGAQSFEHRLDAEDVRAVGLRMMLRRRRRRPRRRVRAPRRGTRALVASLPDFRPRGAFAPPAVLTLAPRPRVGPRLLPRPLPTP